MTALLERVCAFCTQPIVGRKASAIFCSVECNNDALVARRRAAKWVGVRPDRPCVRCGKPLLGKKPHARYCSRRCKMAACEAREGTRINRDVRKGRISSDRVFSFTDRDWKRLCNRYDQRCAYCGQRKTLERDHVLPVSRGGRHSIGNIVPACRSCNLEKRRKFLSEWRYGVREVGQEVITL